VKTMMPNDMHVTVYHVILPLQLMHVAVYDVSVF